jgi:hypothetical protein
VLNGAFPDGLVNVTLDGSTLMTGLTWGAPTDYFSLKSGNHQFSLEQSGSTTNLVPVPFQIINLPVNTQNTFILTAGGVGPPPGILLVDDGTPDPNSGAKIRVANGDAAGAILSGWILPAGTAPSGNPTFANVTIGSASSYQVVPPGNYVITFTFIVQTGQMAEYSLTVAAGQNRTVASINTGGIARAFVTLNDLN